MRHQHASTSPRRRREKAANTIREKAGNKMRCNKMQQDAIRRNGRHASDAGEASRQPMRSSADAAVSAMPSTMLARSPAGEARMASAYGSELAR